MKRNRRMPARLHAWRLRAAAVLLVLPALIVGAHPADAAAGSDRLSRDQQLTRDQSIRSADGRYVLVMQGDGNLVEYVSGRAVWATNTSGSGVRAVMQGDGNFVLYNGAGRAIWASNTGGSAGDTLILQNDANLVLYGGGRSLWASSTKNDRLVRNEWLRANQSITSTDGRYTLVMQGDGNLVEYLSGRAVWASNTAGSGVGAVMQGDGNFVLYNGAGRAIWASNTGGSAGDTLVVQNDANVVLYGGGRALWVAKNSGGSSAPAVGDDYPAKWRNAPQDSLLDSWRYYNRECVSWAAWRLHSRNGFEMGKAVGNANRWDDWAAARGYRVNGTPAVGAVAQSDRGSAGHVAWVSAVGNGTVTIEQYNANLRGTYSRVTVPTGNFRYIHFKDL